jgi:hypothetical protein
VQQDLDFRERLPPRAKSVQPRRDHAGVVEDERVAPAQEVGKLADNPIREAGWRARLDHEQARRVARLDWAQRDPVFGQLEVK